MTGRGKRSDTPTKRIAIPVRGDEPVPPSSSPPRRQGPRIPSPPATRRIAVGDGPPSTKPRGSRPGKTTSPSLPRPDLTLGALGALGPLAERARLGASAAPVPIRHAENRTVGLSYRPPVSPGLELGRLTELLPGSTLMGRYHVERAIGRGSMGVVFSARDLELGERVALKLLDPELSRDATTVARFRAEALAPQRIATPHVVRVLAADVCPELVPLTSPHDPLAPPVPYIVMELLEGHDLRQVLHVSGPLEFRRVAGLLRDLAPTLDRAHALGIVHRDLKPANLFLTKDASGRELVKVLDFGVAELADAGAARGLGGGLFGTPWYMAPEQAASGVATAASDRWALAVVAFRLLTNESYWTPSPVAELLARIVTGPVERPSEVVEKRLRYSPNRIGPMFDAWFGQACAVDPRDRFESAVAQQTAMILALESDAAAAP